MVSETPIHTKYAIVGAGFGGLSMAVALKVAGVEDFVILEKHHNIGGVWQDNTYPGCTCDVPSRLYSFSFAPYRDRRQRYPQQQDILAYLQQVAIDHGLRKHIRFGSEVLEAHFDQTEGRWDIGTTSPSRISAEVVVFAVGQLHKPRYPVIPGLESFGGRVLHSADWDGSIDLYGKRVSVIGTGSSAAQMLPALASASIALTIYQRGPHWVLPKPDSNFGCVGRAMLRIPGAHRAYRKVLGLGADALLSPVVRSNTWRQAVECYARLHLRRQVARKELVSDLMPSYPIGSKKILFDNNFHRSLALENVRLVSEPIKSISVDGIASESGEFIESDVIVCATGFRASEFLLPMSVRGRDGHSLDEDWAAGAEAYLGVAVHGYPNLFMVAGPNSFNPAGSNQEMKELQIGCIMRCLRWKEAIGAQAIKVGRQAWDEYQRWLRRRWIRPSGRPL
ncbi:hypothetical protein E8E12_002056 [Didymella heteroderae]|uniref:Monooxygenase n=1 Tax=Didymella heteroderae TaxID=1769908 RepID=A0A9P4WGI3_9PLEO|nr:hypothetical protein E8E12_002056 [Didymella heteroderae]